MTYSYKPMEYQNTRFEKAKVLCKGTYKNYDFIIVNMGTHPTAYVRLPHTHPAYEKFYDLVNPTPKDVFNQIFTFSDTSAHFKGHLDTEIPEGWYIGWDYAHIGDYVGSIFPNSSMTINTRKYTTTEIIADCESAINYLEGITDEIHEETATQKTTDSPN